jgi:hypothetical protein
MYGEATTMLSANDYRAMASEHLRLACMCRSPESREHHLRLAKQLQAIADREQHSHKMHAPEHAAGPSIRQALRDN